ncbi:hypothetical protein HYZ99_01745 [Candidatus Peregrinibacteria bacterium]|nr:hypothetical protein [Candidatus Peregrinibacteria bacterium]
MSFSKSLRRIVRWIVILFCIWHGSAIAFYSLPPDTESATLNEIRRVTIRLFRPYMLATSQWQQWNLFAPNPLRRVVRYVIQVRQANTWKTIAVLDSGTIEWWRDADELKLLRRLEDGEEYWYPVRNRYLEEFCMQHTIRRDTPIRLVYHYYVIPRNDHPMPLSWWKSWGPEWKKKVGAQTVCPPRQEANAGPRDTSAHAQVSLAEPGEAGSPSMFAISFYRPMFSLSAKSGTP